MRGQPGVPVATTVGQIPGKSDWRQRLCVLCETHLGAILGLMRLEFLSYSYPILLGRLQGHCHGRLSLSFEGFNSGSGGQVTHRAAAVHRLVLCAGDLSTAGGSAASSPCQVWRNPKSTLPETTHRFRRRAETFIHNTLPVLTGARRCYGCLPAYGQ